MRVELVATLFLGAAVSAYAQTAAADIPVLPVQGNVYMLVAPSGNVTVQAGKEGVLVVDTLTADEAPRVIAAIRKFSDKPILWMINTSQDAHHLSGNEALIRLGGDRPRVIAHENILNRLVNPAAGSQVRVAEAASLNDPYFGASKDFMFNGEAVVVYHEPAARTDGDSVVFFRRSDVLSAGDLFTPDRYPVIDLASGGSVNGLINALNHLLDLAIAGRYQEEGTFVIPGHGRLCDEADVVEFRDMVTIIRDRVQDLIKKGRTLEQVKADKPSRDYDTQYAGSPDAFVETIYKSLTARKP